jgi:zinc transporter, ZIP family
MSALTVFAAATVTALATGLGALPFALVRRPSRTWLGIANAVAAGAMLGASAGLVWEGVQAGAWRTALGAAVGAGFIAGTTRVLEHGPELHMAGVAGADALRMLMIVGVMTVHSVTEGVGVGVAFGDGQALGVLITVAIAVHNIPEGLAISLVLVPRGVSVLRAAGWSVFSSVPQPLMAVPAFVFVAAFAPLLPVGLGFAAGAMAWMAAFQLLPEAMAETRKASVAAVTGLAAGLMILGQSLFPS